MIVVSTPLRVSFLGGASDFEDFYLKYGGAVLSTAIDKYVYVIVKERFDNKIVLNYRDRETVDKVSDIKHDLIREAMKITGIEKGIEVTTLADIPSEGTGLGSSSSITVGLLQALFTYQNKIKTQEELAYLACKIEIEILRKPIGRQDQWISAVGGLRLIKFGKSIRVEIVKTDKNRLNENLLMFYTGITRQSGDILSDQKANIKDRLSVLSEMRDLAFMGKQYLEIGEYDEFGKLLHKNWELKKQLSNKISTPQIDEIYNTALKAGAISGKNCFHPNTIIETNEGLKLIKDIKLGDYVYDHTKKLQKVDDVFGRYYNGELLKFKVTGIDEPILVTPEHPLMYTRKQLTGKRINMKVPNLGLYKEAINFKKGECLLIPINDEIIDIDKLDIPLDIVQSKYNKKIYERIPKSVDINEDLLFILGLYIAEGCCSNKQFAVALHRKELDVAQRFLDNIYKIFNVKGKILKNGLSMNGIRVQCSSKVIAHYLPNLCGGIQLYRHIPEFVMKLPLKKQLILLSAMWHGDGYVRHNYDKRMNKIYVRCSYKTISLELAYQIRDICARVGIIANISVSEKEGFRKKGKYTSLCKTSYTVEIYGEDAKVFEEFLNYGYLSEFKRQNIKKLSQQKDIIDIDGIRYIKRSISNISCEFYEGNVYNLGVSNSHTYLAQGIVSHNCGAGAGGFMLFYIKPNKQDDVRKALHGLRELPFRFEKDGSKIIFNYRRGN